MRKICITFLSIAIIILSGVGISLYKQTPVTYTEYLRIHIRADSNEEKAQEVKYKVKDKVVEFLTPYISECDSKEKAQKMLNEKLSEIEKVADKTLKENGFNYTSKAKIKNENFPTRVYDNLTLDSGYYDALIIELGSGKGDNWWCVVYPPLCFKKGGTGYVYKSKIQEIINKFFSKGGKQ